jgi:hypothetical protein
MIMRTVWSMFEFIISAVKSASMPQTFKDNERLACQNYIFIEPICRSTEFYKP